MAINIETIKEKIIQQWVDSMSLDELIGFYVEKTEEFLNQHGNEDIINFALDCGVINESDIIEVKDFLYSIISLYFFLNKVKSDNDCSSNSLFVNSCTTVFFLSANVSHAFCWAS